MPTRRLVPKEGCKPSLLKDPVCDRPVADVPLPPAEVFTAEHYWAADQTPNIDALMAHLSLEGLVAQELVLDIVRRASELFEAEPNLLKLSDPITVVGDIHGQFYDLGKLLEVGGPVSDTQYIFLGDYVDRGSFSIEVVLTLYSLKIKYPKTIRMLRGNHECRQMTTFFNFREECEYKYDSDVYDAIMNSFDYLPLAAILNGKFLVVHGGISPDLPNVKTISRISRFQEPPREGLVCDLLWSDPYEVETPAPRSKKAAMHFVPNHVRQCSYYYTYDGVATFLKMNHLLSVIRAHEAQLEGYKMHKKIAKTGFPSVITIFSAPNYCDVYGNRGAILKFENDTLNILQLNCVPHPYHLPNFMDVFTWSIPFVVEKVTEMLYCMLQAEDGEGDNEADVLQSVDRSGKVYRASLSKDQNEVVDIAHKLTMALQKKDEETARRESEQDMRDRIRRKVRSIGRVARLFKTLREEHETIVKLKGVCPGHKLAPGLILGGQESLRNELENFKHTKSIDSGNEARPEHEEAELMKIRKVDTLTTPKLEEPPKSVLEARPDEDAFPESKGEALGPRSFDISKVEDPSGEDEGVSGKNLTLLVEGKLSIEQPDQAGPSSAVTTAMPDSKKAASSKKIV